MRPKTRSAISAGSSRAGRDDAVQPEADLGRLAAHLQMDVAGAGALGEPDEIFQNFRRGSRRSFFGQRPGFFASA